MLQPALVISAIFGIAQVVVGVVLVRRLVQGWQWQQRNMVIGALAGLWLVTSGVGECVMAVLSQVQSHHPAIIAQARGIVDGILLVVTVMLLVLALSYPLILTMRDKKQTESLS